MLDLISAPVENLSAWLLGLATDRPNAEQPGRSLNGTCDDWATGLSEGVNVLEGVRARRAGLELEALT